MNQHLQKIQDFIQRAETLSAEDKIALAKAVMDTDSVLTNTEFKLDSTEKVNRKTAILLEETIDELEQKRKAVEEKNRDLEIEASLERVRARTMAMQKSDELTDVAGLLFKQVTDMGIKTWTAGFNVWSEDNNYFTDYITSPSGGFIKPYTVNASQTMVLNELGDARKRGDGFFAQYAEGEKLKETYLALSKFGDEKQFEKMLNDGFQFPSHQFNHFVFGAKASLMFITYDPVPEAHDIFKRFGKVFEQTYTRFLDLQKVEEQARESQIQLALERVRARTMAMQHSDELPETSSLLFQQVKELGETAIQNSIAIVNQETRFVELSTTVHGSHLLHTLNVPIDDPYLMAKAVAAWKAKQESLTLTFEGQELKNYNELRNSFLETKINFPEDRWIVHISFFSKGWLSFSFDKNISNEIIDAQKRFAAVFDQTYTRFNDLKQAEEQAREAKVEAALERVRSKTMAMHNSQDVGDTVATMFDELVKLGVEKTIRCGILIFDSSKHMEVWTASSNPNGEVGLSIGRIDVMVHPMLQGAHNAWKRKQPDFSYEMIGEDLKIYYQAINDSPDYPAQFKIASLPSKQMLSIFFFPEGGIFVFSPGPLVPETAQVFKRFAGVFGLTYRRFLDLQKAEAQAREAKIEVALERVRSRTMAMQKSDDLAHAVAIIFEEMDKLNLGTLRCGIGILDKEKCRANVWTTTKSEDETVVQVSGDEPMDIHPLLQRAFDAWVKQDEDCDYLLQGEDLNNFYRALTGTNFKLPDSQSIVTDATDYKQYYYVATFQSGNLYAFRDTAFTAEAKTIIKRFANVFDFTYTRFNDLKQAEQQLREAIKQASLDRVRGEIASMRTTKDLERIIPLVWNELTILGIPFIRCGVFIVDEAAELIHTHLSTPDGKALAAFDLPFDAEGIGREVLPAWRKKQMAAIHWSAKEFAAYTKNLVSQGTVKSRGKYVTQRPDTTLDLHFFPFSQGMLYAGNSSPLSVDEKGLVQSLADAFSTAYARYEDFNKLELAKQQVEHTLTDLKSAQTKLVQSEKMASLGELTAGIAHEIQNPLNFVNNFSEVNQEMIDELEEELKAGNIAEALAIAADIKQNEEKINHHGKRADSIVKGMLQHSRTSGGDKQPTNINALADEFMRLSYHGLRAKDKSFNAEMVTHFDPELPKIEVVGQDIGRVLLNLFNNAFYAVNQKTRTAGADFKPEVSVTTSMENGNVIIKVKDNGVGIPDNIKEKIMQPFFTTKPTGEGTGLGLSLTYDMVVKGHGGTIQVNSVEGEGSEFIIQLPSL